MGWFFRRRFNRSSEKGYVYFVYGGINKKRISAVVPV